MKRVPEYRMYVYIIIRLFLLVSSSSVPPARCISRLRNRSSGFMWQLAVRAVFYPRFCHSKIPATFIAQCIQRAVAEQTVEVLRICACMTRKIFTFLIAEKSIVFPFPIWFFHLLSPHYIKKSSHGTAELVIFKTYFRGFAILLRGRQ